MSTKKKKKTVKKTKVWQSKNGRGGPKKLATSDVKAAIKKVARGRSYSEVGREYGVHGTAIAYHCKKAGVTSAGARV